jgi:exodeoxyribonuclease-3
MKIVCWNVAGIRGSFKKGAMDWLSGGAYDIVCIQETKATEEEADKVAPRWVNENYPHRYWNSCTGEYQHEGFQKKGLSGTCIWSKQPGEQLAHPDFDKEGRTTTVEFGEFIIVTVYTPNSQTPESDRFRYRVRTWDDSFREYVQQLNAHKPTIVCGDFNVAHGDGDVYKPVEYKNMVAGFMNEERDNFSKLLDDANLVDTFRRFHPDDEGAYTFWDQKLPYLRRTNRGWRIDYFLTPTSLQSKITACDQHPTIMGSDHCPITLELTTIVPKTRKRKIRLRIVEEFE